MDIIKKMFKYKHEIVAIRLDGVCYDVYYIDTDTDYEDLTDNDVIVKAFLTENIMSAYYEFTVADIQNAKSVKLYKFVEV